MKYMIYAKNENSDRFQSINYSKIATQLILAILKETWDSKARANIVCSLLKDQNPSMQFEIREVQL